MAIAVALVGLTAVVPRLVSAQDADGFDGFIQSGTCAAPTDQLRVQLESDREHDVEPYLARTGTGDETVVLGYYGSSEVPGFGFGAIYTDRDFSLVVTGSENGDQVACGDILEPAGDRFGEAGTAVVQLLPTADSTIQGLALIQRTQLERELDVTPTRVRILLSEGVPAAAPTDAVEGFDGYIQGGTCDAPTDRLRVQLRSQDDHDVNPFLASPSGGDAVTVGFYGAPGAPGFGLASAYSDQQFSLVVTGVDGGEPAACGDILEPDDDEFAEAGLALVQLLPVADSGVQGFALVERIPLQRELDVTPTRVRILLFAPPATA